MLAQEQMQDALTVGEGTFVFYRLPNGEVQAGDIGKNGAVMFRHQMEGWTPLHQYGKFPWGPYYSDFPLEVLFQRGGAGELSTKQIIGNGFHIRPPKVPTCGLAVGTQGHGGEARRSTHSPRCWRAAEVVQFPQLVGVELPPDASECAFCDRADLPNPKAREQHVRVMHKDEIGQARLGDQMAQGVARVLQGMGIQPRPYGCGQCPESFTDVSELVAHVQMHKSASPTPDAADLSGGK